MDRKLQELFYYDETSKSGLKRKLDWVSGKDGCTVRALAGDDTGSLSSTTPRYYDVYVGHKLERAHVVIWKLLEGEIPAGYVVDHFDGDSLNNLKSNLRLVTCAINGRNQKFRASNASGTNGVHLKVGTVNGRQYSRWIAQWHSLEGRRMQRSFSVEKFGDSSAFKLACEFRVRMIEELNCLGAGYTETHGVR